MRHILFLCFALLCAQAGAQDLLLGQSQWIYDTTALAFKGYDSVENIYNANNLLQIETYKLYNKVLGQWDNSTKKEYFYNANGLNTGYILYSWDGNLWQYYKRRVYTYDANGNLLTETNLNYTGGGFYNTNRREYSYNAQNQLMTELYKDTLGGNWRNLSLWTYHYSNDGLKDTALQQIWLAGTGPWGNVSKYIYTYNAQALLTNTLQKSWNSSTSDWDNYSSYGSTYNAAGKTTVYLIGSYNGILYTPDRRWNYTYQNDLYLLHTEFSKYQPISFNWNLNSTDDYILNGNGLADAKVSRDKNTSGIWENTDSTLYTYDAHGNNVYRLSFGWVNHWSNWRFDNERFYWYQLGTTSALPDVEWQQRIKIYPNPAADIVTVALSIEEALFVGFELRDVTGALLKQQAPRLEAPGLVNTTFDVSDLPAGIYFIKTYSPNKAGVTKLIITR